MPLNVSDRGLICLQTESNYPRSIAEWWFGCNPVLEKLRANEVDDQNQWIVVGANHGNSPVPTDALQADAPSISHQDALSHGFLLWTLPLLVLVGWSQ